MDYVQILEKVFKKYFPKVKNPYIRNNLLGRWRQGRCDRNGHIDHSSICGFTLTHCQRCGYKTRFAYKWQDDWDYVI